jgi:glycosyltransferase involved in cell wall biosynthesis
VRVSAVIPTYNRRAHTFRAIDSVLAQTLPVDEIIVVDDGSTDGTAEAIRSHYGSRVIVLSQANAGVSAARNSGFRASHGDWLAFLDSDDVWLPEKLQQQFDAISTLGVGEFGACFTDSVFEGSAEMRLSAFKYAGLESSSKFGALDDAARYVLARRPVIFVQCLLVRRSLMEELGGFDEAMVVSEDTDVLFRLALKTKVCFVAEPLVRIDRTPSRDVGLCELYGSKDDRVYDSLERMYSKWLALPPTLTSLHRAVIKEMLLSTHYEYAIAKAGQFRLGSALRKLHDAKEMENGYGAVIATLLSRGAKKFRRMAGRARTSCARVVGSVGQRRSHLKNSQGSA